MSQEEIAIAEEKIKFIQCEYYQVLNQRHEAEKQHAIVIEKWFTTTGVAQELVEYYSKMIAARIDRYKELEEYYTGKSEFQQENIKKYKEELTQ